MEDLSNDVLISCQEKADFICENIVQARLMKLNHALQVVTKCHNGHNCEWTNQPVVSCQPVANVLLASSSLFCGMSYGRLKEFGDCISLRLPSESTYYRIQKKSPGKNIKRTY